MRKKEKERKRKEGGEVEASLISLMNSNPEKPRGKRRKGKRKGEKNQIK